MTADISAIREHMAAHTDATDDRQRRIRVGDRIRVVLNDGSLSQQEHTVLAVAGTRARIGDSTWLECAYGNVRVVSDAADGAEERPATCSEACGGNGWIDCWDCGGAEVVTRALDDMTDEEVPCGTCAGVGGWRCPVCNDPANDAPQTGGG